MRKTIRKLYTLLLGILTAGAICTPALADIAPLPPQAPVEQGGFPWATIIAAAVLILAVALVIYLVRRNRKP